jgi:putative hydrolase of the HAD superfamily
MTPPNPERIRCVLFDIGGVLVELTGVQTMLEWMTHRTDHEGLWHAWLHSPAVRAYERGRIGTEEFAVQVVAEFDLSVDAAQFLRGFESWPRGPYPGAHALLEAVRPDLVRACLSNSNVAHWTRVMDEMEFGRHFHHRFASHLIDRIKPDRESFEHACEEMGLAPETVLFIDDNRVNVDGARAAGLEAHRCAGPAETHALLSTLGLLTR